MKRPEAEMKLLKERWKELLFRVEFREKSAKEQGLEVGVSRDTILEWRRGIGAERWKKILEMTREAASEQTVEVDDALFRRAKTGDPAACKLWYEVHGWSPKQNLVVEAKRPAELSQVETEELLKAMVKDVPLEELERMKVEAAQPVKVEKDA